jgi:hypothetical protein
MLEAVTGPVATNAFGEGGRPRPRQRRERPGRRGLFLKLAPPRGIAMRCAIDVYSYAQIRVTSTAVRITPKNED